MTQVERVLIHNLEALLDARGMKPADLVRMIGSDRSASGRRSHAWLSRILNPPADNPKEARGMRLPDIERVAKVFGLAPHELLTPGISRFTERRHAERRRKDRRTGKDRRKQDAKRFLKIDIA